MDNLFLLNQLKVLKLLFPCESILVIGSGKGENLALLDTLNIQGAILVEADEDQIEKMYKLHELPSTFTIENTLIYKDEKSIVFNIATNSEVSCFKDIESYRRIMPNIALIETKEMKAVSLDTFLQQHKQEHINWLIIDTFTSLEILQESKKAFNELEVIICKLMTETFDEFHGLMLENGYKLLQKDEENNPDILITIFIKDYKKVSTEIQNKNNELNSEILDLKSDVGDVKEKEQKLEKEIILQKKKLEEKNILIDDLQQKMTNEKVAFNQEIKKLESELSVEKQSRLELNKVKDTLFHQLEKLQDDMKNSKDKEEDLQKELRTSKKKLSEAVQRTDSLIINIKERDAIIKSFLEAPKGNIPLSYFSKLDYKEKIDAIANYCIKQEDILETIDNFILVSELNENEKFDLCCSFAIKIAEHGDKYQGVSFLNNARYFLDKASNKEQYKKLIELASSLDSVALAVDLEMEFNKKYGDFSPEINKKIFEEYKNIRSISLKKQAHGHDLLIEYIEKHVKDNDQTGKILVEIGTTRENIPGQGSTMQLAQLCKRKNIRFITVDMDKHNSRWATFISHKYNLNITAITKKGEDYLRDDIKNFDFVFLDAYDFDHGMHSELRQSRYEQSLGAKIDEEACHLMHLECAKSVVKKLQKKGVVCVDDTWLDKNKKWMAKGTLAVPFLLDNGYEVIEQRNRALLLKKKEIS